MAFVDPPYAVAKTDHSARLFRRQFQQSVGEGSGISRPGDLKVQALNVPGNGFRVAPGGGIAQSRDTSTTVRESYGPVNNEEIVVTDVPGTGSGGTRRDLVIVEITDPAMQSVTYPSPADPDYTGAWLLGSTFTKITVIQGVAAGVKSLDQITTGPYANVTGVTLAAINWPVSTATITSAMIEDLRTVQSPRSVRILRTWAAPSGFSSQITNTSAWPAGGDWWPSEFVDDVVGAIDIPAWAQRARIVMTWGGVKLPAGAAYGATWVQIGLNSDPNRVNCPNTAYQTPGATTLGKTTMLAACDIALPAAMRGTSKKFLPKANRTGGTAAAAPILDAGSSLVIDVEFYETAV
ncbi:hypothetical protein [Leucobacter japonicus]|uniref:hypothetical protein n=1 Tax=Leucobacter japonicus TaxID=1461259 RepID=UPI0012E2681D|nr:hypothetical protein [Leucobacter japonicus]